MSVTVVTRRRARPGQAEVLFELASRRILELSGKQDARLQTRLFQGVDDAHLLLRVGHWDNLDGYWSAMRVLGGFEPLDELCVGGGERFFFERLSLYEDMGRKSAAVDCALLQAPPGQGGQVSETILQRNAPTVRAQPGLVLNAVYQDLDDIDRFFVMQGWESDAAQQHFLANTGRSLEAQLDTNGVRIERYAVHTRVEVDRYARRQSEGRTTNDNALSS